jgi:hypothetical protein
MSRLFARTVALLSVSFLLCVFPSVSRAADEIIPAGPDLLFTNPGTFFIFPGIGQVNFLGRPNAQGVDTIIQRLNPIQIDDTIGSTQMINTQITLLNLQSAAPVNIGGSFFDVFVHLTPNTVSPGNLTITQTVNGEGIPEGTFVSFFDIFFTADFSQGGVTSPCPIPGNGCSFELTLTGNGTWTDDLGNQFLAGRVTESHPGNGVHIATPIPEPSAALLISAGLCLLGLVRRRL